MPDTRGVIILRVYFKMRLMTISTDDAMQVFDETVSVVRVITRWSEFYQHESCGKCTPCREGTYWMKQIMLRLERGEGRPGDVDLLDEIAHNIAGRSFCPLGDAAATPIMAGIKRFRDEFEAGLTTPRCV